MTPVDTRVKAANVSRNEASRSHSYRNGAGRFDWIDGAARLVAALTLAGTAALVAPPLAAALGPAAAHAPFYLAIALTASTLGRAGTLVTIGISALALLLRSPSLAAGALSLDDALAVALFVVTGMLIAAALGRLPRERDRMRSFARLARLRARERDDAREAREALRARMLEQSSWYESTLQALDEAVVAADTDGRVRFVNAAAERLTQRSAADALGRRIDYVLPLAAEHDRIDLSSRVRDALASGHVLSPAEAVMLATGDGIKCVVHFTLTPVRSHTGSLLGGVAVVRDASRARRADRERGRLVKTAQQAESIAVAAKRSLELAERKFAAFIGELPFPAYIVAENGEMIFVNDAGRRTSGWREALADARNGDDGECTIDVPGEGRRYVDVRFPIGADGRTWIGGFAIDVSERTRAQRALRERTDELDALLRHLPFPVWVARGSDRPDIRCNGAARALSAGDRDWPPIRQCIAERRAVTDVELEVAAANGTKHTLRMTAVPLVGANREVRGAIAFAIDSTPFAECEAVLSRVSASSH